MSATPVITIFILYGHASKVVVREWSFSCCNLSFRILNGLGFATLSDPRFTGASCDDRQSELA